MMVPNALMTWTWDATTLVVGSCGGYGWVSVDTTND